MWSDARASHRTQSKTTVTDDDATVRIDAPMQGTIVAVHVAAGDAVEVQQPLLVIESMKMEHVIASEHTGVVERVAVEVGRHRPCRATS